MTKLEALFLFFLVVVLVFPSMLALVAWALQYALIYLLGRDFALAPLWAGLLAIYGFVLVMYWAVRTTVRL